MSINTFQKIIKIGSSMGVTLPAKDIRRLNLKPGDQVEVEIRLVDNDEKSKKLAEVISDYESMKKTV